jgi:DNA-directed RNA polymerase subunit M/transcription elongation factor TFIIS
MSDLHPPVRAALVNALTQRTQLDDLHARDMEVGIYNWALSRADEYRVSRNWQNPKFRAIYQSKARSVLCNADPTAYVGNTRLGARILEHEFAPHEVAGMKPENVFPERWQNALDLQLQRDKYIHTARPAAMTDQFRCGRCKKRECAYQELQTRSCDEPASLFITCLNCGHRWRLG